MKRISLFFAASLVLAASSCTNAPKADKAEATDAKIAQSAAGISYKTDLAQSHVDFTGTKPVGQHHGAFMLKDGNVMVDGSTLTGGKFVIDINSMKMTDADTSGASKLHGHLLSADFFNVEKYGTSAFEITSVKACVDTAGGKELVMKDATHTITGNLTLKDATRSVTFPANVQVSDNSVIADANFNIDRTQWNLSYGNDHSLGDHFIRPLVNIQFHIVANK